MVKVLGILALCLAFTAQAEPVASAAGGGVSISLYTDKCALSAVSNLPFKATWTEKGKVSQGCYGVAYQEVVMLYFEDKTVVVLPVGMFKKVTGV